MAIVGAVFSCFVVVIFIVHFIVITIMNGSVSVTFIVNLVIRINKNNYYYKFFSFFGEKKNQKNRKKISKKKEKREKIDEKKKEKGRGRKKTMR